MDGKLMVTEKVTPSSYAYDYTDRKRRSSGPWLSFPRFLLGGI
jgi:hypothetical protein